MQKRVRNRLYSLLALVGFVAVGVYIILINIEDNIVFFYPPSEIDKIIEQKSNKVRVGGLVKEGSIRNISPSEIIFTITDYKAELDIKYKGVLPALFREKQGIVAEGRLISNNLFLAKKLLAKHDENYMPPEVAALIVKERN